MKIGQHDLGVCSWSLHPKDHAELVALLKQLGLSHVQLALGPLVLLDDKRKHLELGHLRAGGITITSGMMGFPGEDYSTIAAIRRTGGFVPDDLWPVRKQLMHQAALLAKELGLKMLLTHMGFIPPSSDPKYGTMIERATIIAEDLGEQGLDLLMETGQESAPELLQFMNDVKRKNVFVNFDPANMILYGAGDPIDAIEVLGRHIKHVHVKDAVMSKQPGIEWGTEVPFGTGEVPPEKFLLALASAGFTGPIAIEREAGENRVADIRFAIETLKAAAS